MKNRSKVALPEQELTVSEAVMFQGRILHFVENLGAMAILMQVGIALRKLSNDAVKVNDFNLADVYEAQIKAVVIAIEAIEETV